MSKWFVINIFLFALLSPGVLGTLPGSKVVSTLLHAVLFAAVHCAMRYYVVLEFFENPDSRINPACPPNSVPTASGDCRLATDRYGLQ